MEVDEFPIHVFSCAYSCSYSTLAGLSAGNADISTLTKEPYFLQASCGQIDLDPVKKVAEVAADLVTPDVKGQLSIVRYEAVNAMLLNEFLKEHKKVEKLEATVIRQQQGIDALVAHIKEQDSKIQRVSDHIEMTKGRRAGGLRANSDSQRKARTRHSEQAA
jgi:uncharacterized coiled-coil protein SlyX